MADDVSDVLDCVATFGRSLDRSFHPARFLSEFSVRAQRLVPHDYMLIQRREGDGHTCSTLAECAVRGPLLGQRTHYTTAFERGVRVPADVFALRPVFEGHAQIIADMTTKGIPPSYVDAGSLHIAYEYAYANELLMSRGDKKAFSTNISGDVGSFIDLGVQGAVSVASTSTISFKNAKGLSAAFAYKAGRLAREEGKWVLYPETVSKVGLTEERTPFLPQPGVVLHVSV